MKHVFLHSRFTARAAITGRHVSRPVRRRFRRWIRGGERGLRGAADSLAEGHARHPQSRELEVGGRWPRSHDRARRAHLTGRNGAGRRWIGSECAAAITAPSARPTSRSCKLTTTGELTQLTGIWQRPVLYQRGYDLAAVEYADQSRSREAAGIVFEPDQFLGQLQFVGFPCGPEYLRRHRRRADVRRQSEPLKSEQGDDVYGWHRLQFALRVSARAADHGDAGLVSHQDHRSDRRARAVSSSSTPATTWMGPTRTTASTIRRATAS